MYLQIMEQVKRKVMAGDWTPGFALPSIRELAATIGVSVITIKRAYLELEREGVIVTQQGRGSFISENGDAASQLLFTQMQDHLSQAAAIGRVIGLNNKELSKQLNIILTAGGPGKTKGQK